MPIARLAQPEGTSLPIGDVLDFMGAIWSVDHALQAVSRRMQVTLGITGPQRLVVRIVGRFPGVPTGALAEVLRVHPSTITGILDRLASQGLVERRRDPRDRRRILVGLTKNGRAIDLEQEGTVEDAVRTLLRSADPEAVATTRDLLTRLAAALEAHVPRPRPARGTRRAARSNRGR